MRQRQNDRIAYDTALQFERLVLRIISRTAVTHPEDVADLRHYTNQVLRCLRRSNNCVGTERGCHESVQAAVWMVEALIILTDFLNHAIEPALVTAAMELLYRVETALRDEGSLPPARDPM